MLAAQSVRKGEVLWSNRMTWLSWSPYRAAISEVVGCHLYRGAVMGDSLKAQKPKRAVGNPTALFRLCFAGLCDELRGAFVLTPCDQDSYRTGNHQEDGNDEERVRVQTGFRQLIGDDSEVCLQVLAVVWEINREG